MLFKLSAKIEEVPNSLIVLGINRRNLLKKGVA